MKRPVLVLGAEPRIAVTIARSLQRRGIPTDVGALTASEPRLRSRAVRNFIRFPSPSSNSAGFLKELREQIKAQGYDVLIPCSDSTLTACLNHYEELSELLHVACPPRETSIRILNKELTLEAAERCGIRFPKTYNVATSEDLDTARNELRFPVLAKPREKRRAGAFKSKTFRTLEELQHAFAETPEFGKENLIQELCRGVGVGVEVLMDRGEAIAVFQHRRLKELPATGGVSVLAVAEEIDPRLAEISIRLLRELDWYGVAMVEFLYDPSSDVAVLMEVNGRYWGSIALATHAGVDFPGLHWQVIHGERPDVLPPYRRKLRARWFTGDLLRLHSLFFPLSKSTTARTGRWSALAQFVTDCRPGTRDMLWSWKDPLPGFLELIRELRHMIAAPVRNALGNVVPKGMKSWFRTYRGLGRGAGRWFLKRRLGRSLGLVRDASKLLPLKIHSVVCVCHGNIIRSPFASELLKRSLGDGSTISVFSAGMHATKGKPADERAIRAASELGVSLNTHGAEPLTREMAERADLILIMDFENEAEMLSRFPEVKHKLFLVGGLPSTNKYPTSEIGDPYEGDTDEVRNCYERIKEHIVPLADVLSKQG